MDKNKLDTTDLLLSQGDIDGAIASLIDCLSSHKNKNLYKNAVLLQTRWASIKTQNLQGVISTQDYQLSFNKIALDISNLISDSKSKYLRKESTEKKIGNYPAAGGWILTNA